ncbi:TIGR03618 family F420-dependent PPOX class oxidoreductase [Jatrophihabitans sp. YIM 134969]
MTTVIEAVALARADQGLAVVATVRADGTIQSTLVNAGVLPHPVTGEQALAFVASGRHKLANLRARPQTALTFREGWRYGTVEGRAELIGPDDPADGFDPERIRLLLREIFTAAGGTHDDWDEFDRVMRDERRTAVVVTPTRVYGT